MAGYIGANTSSVTNNQNAAERRKKFTFTANTTVLSGLNFAPQKIHIFHNGIRLVRTTDYTEAADGKSVTLVNAAQAGDEVVAVTFSQNPSSGGYSDTDVDAHLLTAGVTLDATNDRVGINESTPTGSLHVKGTSTTHGKIILEAGGSGGSANNNYMEFNKHDGTKLGEIEIGESVSNGGSILLKTTPSGGSATTRMTINHDGIVTMPNQPSVSGRAIRPEYGAGYATTGVNLYFNDMTHSTGNHFNNSTGVFTCPVAGRYFCYGAFLIDDNHSAGALARFSFFRNNSEFFISYNHDKYGSSYGGTHTTGGIFSCAANDTITCKVTHGQFHTGGESSFSICLLG